MRLGRFSEGEPCKVPGCPFRELADGLCIEHLSHPAVEDPAPPSPAPPRAKPSSTPKE